MFLHSCTCVHVHVFMSCRADSAAAPSMTHRSLPSNVEAILMSNLISSNETSRAVLLTGAAGGVGVATTRALTEQGYRVFAGVRNVSRFPGATSDVIPVQLDVTDPESISAAVQTVRARSGDALYAVINNAGVIVQGPMELVPAEELHRQFAVNVYGPALVAQAFLPLLRRGHGRLVNITASTARVPGLFYGPISASKAALQALSDAL